ncbi:hypothetical protein AAHA48_15400 [Dickeya oryzae]
MFLSAMLLSAIPTQPQSPDKKTPPQVAMAFGYMQACDYQAWLP